MKKVIYGLMAFAPVLALAQGLGQADTLVQNIRSLINNIIPVLFGLAIIYFFWGLIKYIRAAGDPKAAAEGRSIMIWGVIALVVMVGVYGLINWVLSTTGLDNNNSIPPLPQV
jgi:uncharacterized membrane protein